VSEKWLGQILRICGFIAFRNYSRMRSGILPVDGNPLPETLGKQIVRAADSIGANIAEGSGRGSSQDNRRFIRMARGSLCETQHWLRRAFSRKLLTTGQVDKLKPIIDELSPKINSYLQAVSKTVESQGQRLVKAKDQRSKSKDQKPRTEMHAATA
jgi:four helix bundle protein